MPCIAAFFVSGARCRRARRPTFRGFSVIAHQARLAPADTFISAGRACPAAPSGVAFTPLQGWKTPEKQPPAMNYGFSGIHG